MTKEESLELLRSLEDEGRRVTRHDEAGFKKFRQRGRMLLRRIFGDANPHLNYWNNIRFSPRSISFDSRVNDERHLNAWLSGMESSVTLLQTAREELETFGAESPGPEDASDPPAIEGASRRVFVVHGHDEGLKQTVARTLEKLELEAVILHEQANEGRTLIEKFEDYADVSFAVVLLTPDDMGYRTGEDPDTARPRARQNVILELGFFLGKLGRGRVAALFSGDKDFEKPSDLEGVLYIPLDDGGQWQFGLVKELKAAGIEVDANLIT